MPRLNGYECLKAIKANKKLSTIRIIIYSTSLDISMIDYLYENGAQYYLQKPAEFSNLKTALQKLLDQLVNPGDLYISKEQFVIQA